MTTKMGRKLGHILSTSYARSLSRSYLGFRMLFIHMDGPERTPKFPLSLNMSRRGGQRVVNEPDRLGKKIEGWISSSGPV